MSLTDKFNERDIFGITEVITEFAQVPNYRNALVIFLGETLTKRMLAFILFTSTDMVMFLALLLIDNDSNRIQLVAIIALVCLLSLIVSKYTKNKYPELSHQLPTVAYFFGAAIAIGIITILTKFLDPTPTNILISFLGTLVFIRSLSLSIKKIG
ncbi:hypothetical protein HY990_04540 [Candidatus Micrarchaeota archaeon]|nr:hypothetical protein [Candidatus Micrarchaeota archaeon]